MLVNIAFYLNILEPAKVLQWTLQDHEIDTLKVMNALPKPKVQLEKKKDLEEFPLIKSFLNKVTQNE